MRGSLWSRRRILGLTSQSVSMCDWWIQHVLQTIAFFRANLCLVWWSLISTFGELDVYDLTAVQKFKSLMKSVWAKTGAYDLFAVQTLRSPGKSVIKNASLSIAIDASLKKVIILLLCM